MPAVRGQCLHMQLQWPVPVQMHCLALAPPRCRAGLPVRGAAKSAGASSVSVLDSKIASAALTPIIVSMRGGAVLCCAVLAMLKLRMTECMCACWCVVCDSACVKLRMSTCGGDAPPPACILERLLRRKAQMQCELQAPTVKCRSGAGHPSMRHWPADRADGDVMCRSLSVLCKKT